MAAVIQTVITHDHVVAQPAATKAQEVATAVGRRTTAIIAEAATETATVARPIHREHAAAQPAPMAKALPIQTAVATNAAAHRRPIGAVVAAAVEIAAVLAVAAARAAVVAAVRVAAVQAAVVVHRAAHVNHPFSF